MGVPKIGDQVHYVSFGTPGGEYGSRCRAAVVAEVGQWVTQGTQTHGSDDQGRKHRSLLQRFEADAVALAVLNPTGLFFNGAGAVGCQHDTLPPADKIAPGERTEFRGGTWHWPGQEGCTA